MTISEHFSQFFPVSRAKLDLKDINIYQRNYSNFDSNSFRGDISIQKWDNNFADVNDQFNDFYKRLDSTVERHDPLKKLSKKDMKLKSKPWLTPAIINLINNRNKLYGRTKRQPKNENISKLYNLFRNRTEN